MDNKFWRIEYKLPKGFKWKDGEKHKVIWAKKKHMVDGDTITLLEVDNDLYINGAMYNIKKHKKSILVINNWKSVSIHDIRIEFSQSYPLCDILLKYYHKHGIYCGLMVPILRDINSCVKQENI